MDIDDAYIADLVDSFSDAFAEHGGEVVKTRILFDTSPGFAASLAEASEVLTAAAVDGIFFPLYPNQATPFLEQLPAGLRDLVLISADALLTPEFLGLEESEGLYIVGPIATFGNVNSVTGQSEAVVKDTIETVYGDAPGSFWQHSYDAVTLLLSAIESVAQVSDDGTLRVDRAGLRAELAATDGFQGLIGAISCDPFGDCGNGVTNVYYHASSEDTDVADLEVFYQFVP